MISVSIYCQKSAVLNFHTHSIKNEINNEMKICKFSNPGNGGENVTWDFSNLEVVEDFTGFVKSSYQTSNSEAFPQANTELQEFNNHFYFKVDESRIEQYGYTTNDNSVVVKFEKPFLKMLFPFSYGDEETGDFYGLINVGEDTGSITGTYKISADGYGTLILPGNITVYNTLRVKSDKNYEQNIGLTRQEIKIETYRWYAESNRYPLLVLTEVTTNSSNKSYQAAFNNEVLLPSALKESETKVDDNFTVLPNPVNDVFKIFISDDSNNSKMIFEFFDITGKKVNTVFDEHIPGQFYSKTLNTKEIGLEKGLYILRATVGENSYSKHLIVAQ